MPSITALKEILYKKVCFNLFFRQYTTLLKISAETNIDWAILARGFLDDGLSSYLKLKDRMEFAENLASNNPKPIVVLRYLVQKEKVIEVREVIVEKPVIREIEVIKEVQIYKPVHLRPIDMAAPDTSSQKVYCQNPLCKKEVAARKTHIYRINLETFRFCEECFFTGNYRELVRQLI